MLQPPTSSPLPPSSRALHLPRSVPQPHPSPSSLLVTAPVGQQHRTAAISPSLAATSSSPAELLPRELSLLFSGRPSPPAGRAQHQDPPVAAPLHAASPPQQQTRRSNSRSKPAPPALSSSARPATSTAIAAQPSPAAPPLLVAVSPPADLRLLPCRPAAAGWRAVQAECSRRSNKSSRAASDVQISSTTATP